MSPPLEMPTLYLILNGKFHASDINALIHASNTGSGLLVPWARTAVDSILFAPPQT